jgi:hypothetical protein
VGKEVFMSSNVSPGCRPIDPDEAIAHLGGRGVDSALAWTGTRKIGRSETELRLYANGRAGWQYVISVTVNGGDLYDIELWGLRGQAKQSLGKQADIFSGDLQTAVEELYDAVMRDTNGGVIPLR